MDLIVEIKMPKLGLTMTEGTLTRWLVQSGQAVRQGDLLFAFESEKSALEFESPADGVMGALLAAEGATVACGTPVAILETAPRAAKPAPSPTRAQAPLPAARAAAARPASEALPAARLPATPAAKRRARELGVDLAAVQGRGINGRIHLIDVEARAAIAPPAPTISATPVARRLAADLGVDLAQVQGSGPDGRITRDDVARAVRARAAAPAVATPPDAAPAALPAAPFSRREPLSGVRRAIAHNLSRSAFSAPHVTLHTEVDATHLVQARRQLNQSLAGTAKISYNALLIAIAARALRDFPQVNACLLDDELCVYADVNVGLAVDTARGLLVPVVRQADRLGLLAIQETAAALAQRALDGQSLPDDLSGGTFTITNLGAYGVDAFTPIINQPQAAILGVGRILNKPVGVAGELLLQDRLTLSLSFDHRIVDGAPAAQFLQRVGQLVERPLALIL
jgi:pyruvate dehydrogenase E2 component (dihydrolipoamide acetyltransferase)